MMMRGPASSKAFSIVQYIFYGVTEVYSLDLQVRRRFNKKFLAFIFTTLHSSASDNKTTEDQMSLALHDHGIDNIYTNSTMGFLCSSEMMASSDYRPPGRGWQVETDLASPPHCASMQCNGSPVLDGVGYRNSLVEVMFLSTGHGFHGQSPCSRVSSLIYCLESFRRVLRTYMLLHVLRCSWCYLCS